MSEPTAADVTRAWRIANEVFSHGSAPIAQALADERARAVARIRELCPPSHDYETLEYRCPFCRAIAAIERGETP